MNKAVRIVTAIVLLSIALAIALIPTGSYSYQVVEYEPIPFEVMVQHNIDVAYAEWLAEQEVIDTKSAPYECISLDDELQIYLEERCAEYDIDFFIMASLIFSESSFRTSVYGDSGKSYGLCQIRKVWWDVMAEQGLDVFEPMDNIEIGLKIFKENLDKADGDYEKAIQYYKCGASRGSKLWKQGKRLSVIDEILYRADEWRNE